MNKGQLLTKIKKNLGPGNDIIDGELILHFLAAAITFAESFQQLPPGTYNEHEMDGLTEEAVIMLATYYVKSRDGQIPTINGKTGREFWDFVSKLLRPYCPFYQGCAFREQQALGTDEHPKLAENIKVLHLSTRGYNAFARWNRERYRKEKGHPPHDNDGTIGDIIYCIKSEKIEDVRNLGPKSYWDLVDKVRAYLGDQLFQELTNF